MTATRFEGRAALVTGAANGIGRAIALRLAAEGAAVAVADIEAEAAGAVAADIEAASGTALAVHCDVTDEGSVAAAVAAAVSRFGRLDVLVNNVGVATGKPFDELDDEVWDMAAEPTLRGTMRCIRAALPHLLAAPAGGSVVSIGSVNGLAAFGDVAYSAAKAGLTSMTQNLAVLYGRGAQQESGSASLGVRFTVVAPGSVRTRNWTGRPDGEARLERLAKIYPAGRVGEPADIAAAVAFLASDDASWITGIVLPVDGGILAGPARQFQAASGTED